MKDKDLLDFADWLADECELEDGIFTYEGEDYSAKVILEEYLSQIKNQ